MKPPTPTQRQYDGDWTIKQVLAREAELESKPPDILVCPECAGLGRVKDPLTANGDFLYGQLIQCPSCSTPARERWLARNCGIEGSAMDARLAGWGAGNWPDVDADERERRTEQRRAAWRAIDCAIKARYGLFTFWGDFGSGKTHALNIVCNELRAQLVETYYAPLASVLGHLRSLYGQKVDTSDYWQRLLDVPVLALDEVTRFNATAWAQEMLFVLVDTRYRRRASHLTLFGTNDDPNISLPPSEALGYLYSRMREAQEGALVELRGDMRPAVAK